MTNSAILVIGIPGTAIASASTYDSSSIRPVKTSTGHLFVDANEDLLYTRGTINHVRAYGLPCSSLRICPTNRTERIMNLKDTISLYIVGGWLWNMILLLALLAAIFWPYL